MRIRTLRLKYSKQPLDIDVEHLLTLRLKYEIKLVFDLAMKKSLIYRELTRKSCWFAVEHLVWNTCVMDGIQLKWLIVGLTASDI